MMPKVFIVSDVHGHFTQLQKALSEAGFDEQDEQHFLLSLGDHFDRGRENAEVYTYLRRLQEKKKAEALLGNHDTFLLEFFEKQDDRVRFNIAHNGFGATLESFSGIPYEGPASLDIMRRRIHSRYPKLYDWLRERPLFLERGPYIFVHGGIDGSDPNWRETPGHDLVWNYQSEMPGIEGRTLVVGHERTVMIRMKRGEVRSIDPGAPALFDVIEEADRVFIDGAVEFSGRINVYTLELDEPIIQKEA